MEESISILSRMKEKFGVEPADIKSYSPLALAYMGDCVYDLIIRTLMVSGKNRPVNIMHKEATHYVKAEAQAKIVDAILSQLSEEEQSVYRRGKNAKPHSVSKGGTVNEYHKATGLEAVLGYLYLQDKTDRIMEIMKQGVDVLNGGNSNGNK